jgi:hypothetical protein
MAPDAVGIGQGGADAAIHGRKEFQAFAERTARGVPRPAALLPHLPNAISQADEQVFGHRPASSSVAFQLQIVFIK